MLGADLIFEENPTVGFLKNLTFEEYSPKNLEVGFWKNPTAGYCKNLKLDSQKYLVADSWKGLNFEENSWKNPAVGFQKNPVVGSRKNPAVGSQKNPTVVSWKFSNFEEENSWKNPTVDSQKNLPFEEIVDYRMNLPFEENHPENPMAVLAENPNQKCRVHPFLAVGEFKSGVYYTFEGQHIFFSKSK